MIYSCQINDNHKNYHDHRKYDHDDELMMTLIILSTQLSWDQQSDKNLSNSTDARAHSNELRIKVIILIMVEMAMWVIKDAFQ